MAKAVSQEGLVRQASTCSVHLILSFALRFINRPGKGGTGGPGGLSLIVPPSGGGSAKVNPGGCRGPDGKSGSRGASAEPGINANNGDFSIFVSDGPNTSTYDDTYNMSLLDVELVSEKEDGVIEPGSRVFVSSIQVENIGGMPTPTLRSVLAYIKPEELQPPTLTGENWVLSEGLNRFVQLPPALEPEEIVTVSCASLTRKLEGTVSVPANPASEHLAFRVAPINPVTALSSHPDRHERGAPFCVSTSVVIRAQMEPFGRDFPNFIRPERFDIHYPVQMSEVTSFPSLPPGGQTLVRFSIKNISQKDYGTEGQIGRKVMVKISYSGGDLDPSKLTYTPIRDDVKLDPVVFSTTTPSTPISHKGQVIRTINLLPARATIELTGWLTISEDVAPYTSAKFSVDLLLGEIHDPSNVVLIQRREMGVCVSKPYKKTLDSSILLVTNNKTTQAEREAWEALAELVFGSGSTSGIVDIWDISQEGHFNLNRVLPGETTLCGDWQDRTIIILDNPFDNFATRAAVGGPDDCALNYLNQDQLVSAMVTHGVHFCVVSPLVDTSNAQHHYLAYPKAGIPFSSTTASGTLRELLNPFAITSCSFIVYESPRDFIAAEVDVHVDGTPMTEMFNAPWSSKTRQPIHQTNLEASMYNTQQSPLYTHMEYVVLLIDDKPFKSSTKVVKLMTTLRKQLLRKHPERRYAMSACGNATEVKSLASQAQFDLPPMAQAAIRIRRYLDVSSLTTRITLTGAPASPVDTTVLDRSAATIHTPSFIRSPQITSAFLQSIPFLRKVAIYSQTLVALDGSGSSNDEWRANVLRASLLADLACEQAALRARKKTHGLTESSITQLLRRLAAFCEIDLPTQAVDGAGRRHLLGILAEFTAYMKVQLAWYDTILPARRSQQVTKSSMILIDRLFTRLFPAEFPSKAPLRAASNSFLKQWKRDVQASSRTANSPNQAVNVKGRAFAALLGTVAGGKIEWLEEDQSASTAGVVCTEFGFFFAPDSPQAVTRNPRPLSINVESYQPIETAELGRSGIVRKATIASRETANRRALHEHQASISRA